MNDRLALTFLTGKRRFNYRVAAVVIREGNVLVCREDDDDFVMLPGGRVEFGEGSAGALQREIGEELGCRGKVGRLLFSAESFFERDGERFHEIGKYYLVDLPADFPFSPGGTARVTRDEGHDLVFRWVRVAPKALEAENLSPAFLWNALEQLPARTRFIVADEG
ncbi:MAG TPA: NUDIX domain-containing protein [Devosia sp.]|nr:NUDIX domain-containing protein [Devosia sp.]